MISDDPLIHTTRGNVPVAALKHSVSWRISPLAIVFTETYKDDSGEIVRQDAHVCALAAEAQSDATTQEPA